MFFFNDYARYFFGKRPNEWKIDQAEWNKCENFPDEDRAGKYTITIAGKDFQYLRYKNGVTYIHGVCFMVGDTQVNFGFLDLTKKHLHQDELDKAITDVAMSFNCGEHVTPEE